MDEKDFSSIEELEVEDLNLEDTKEVKTLSDLAIDTLENMEMYQEEFDEHIKESEEIFEEKVLEEVVEEPISKQSFFSKCKEKWSKLSKKQKSFIIIGIVLFLILFVTLILMFFFSSKPEDVIIPKEPDVILEMGNYRYENGKLVFLDGDKELGTYECENKNENLCKLALMSEDTIMDMTRKVDEVGNPIPVYSKIYFDRFVFLQDEKEGISKLKLYDLKESKVLKEVFEVFVSSYDNYVVIKDEEGRFGLSKFLEEEFVSCISPSYDAMNFIPNQEELKVMSVRKDNNSYLVNLEDQVLTKAITNTIVGANSKYIKTKDSSNHYHVHDYNAKLVLDEKEVLEYVELLDDFMLFVRDGKLEILDYEGRYITMRSLSLHNDTYNPVEVYKNQKREKVNRAWRYEIHENIFTLYLINGEEEQKETIDLQEAHLSSKLYYMNYFDGTLYFYSDKEKKELFGSYECTNRNNLGENVTTLSQCKPAMDSVFRETRNTKETADFGGGVIPVFGKKYMFIQDGNIIVLQDLSSSSTLAKYESVDTSSYTGQSDGLSFVTTANVYFIAKSASSKKFGVANITSDGVKPVIPFDKDSILTLGDYYVVEENKKYSLYDETGKKVTNDKVTPIVDYHKTYLKTMNNNNQYFVHTFTDSVTNYSYDYVELYDEFYAVVLKGRVHLYRYDDEKLEEYIYDKDKEKGIELETDKYYNHPINAFRITISKESISVEIGGTNGVYKSMGTFSTLKTDKEGGEEQDDE